MNESEARLQAVIEDAHLAIAFIGASGKILFRNPRFDQLWGRPPHVTTARTYSEVYEGYHLDDRLIASEKWPEARAVLRGETIENEVYEIVQASGRRITCWFGAVPIRNTSGEIAGAVVVFRDLTKERRIEAALRESQEKYRTLFDTMAEGFAVIEPMRDDAGTPTDVSHLELNAAIEQQIGIGRDCLLGRRLSELLPPADVARWAGFYGCVAEDAEPAAAVDYVERLERWIEVSA